jgi:hypothetical protein
METNDGRRSVTMREVAVTLVPTTLALVTAVMMVAQGPDLTLHRIINTIWISTALLIPALCLFAVRRTDVRRRYALLLYTSAYAAYMVHFYFAVVVHFGGIQGTFAGMRKPIATTNFVLTAWWTLDLLVAWLAPLDARWVRVERFAAMTFLYLVFVVTELFLRPTAIKYLGFTLAVLVPICLVSRLLTPSPVRV